MPPLYRLCRATPLVFETYWQVWLRIVILRTTVTVYYRDVREHYSETI